VTGSLVGASPAFTILTDIVADSSGIIESGANADPSSTGTVNPEAVAACRQASTPTSIIVTIVTRAFTGDLRSLIMSCSS
jgi:hypothetical protein